MASIRWTPRTDLETYSRDPFFRGLWDLFDDRTAPANHVWYPAMDVVDEQDRLVVNVDLPGIDPKDVQVNLQNDVLTVHGERKHGPESNGKVLKREQVYGSFTRTLELPYRVQVDAVKAQYRNGVMSIALPKAEEHIGRQIPVELEK
jgi:HSP20 family protein